MFSRLITVIFIAVAVRSSTRSMANTEQAGLSDLENNSKLRDSNWTNIVATVANEPLDNTKGLDHENLQTKHWTIERQTFNNPSSVNQEKKVNPTTQNLNWLFGPSRALLKEANEVRLQAGNSLYDVNRRRRNIEDIDSPDNSTNRDEAQEILDLLKIGEGSIGPDIQKYAVVVLGNTGSGKSTLTRFITGNGQSLISEEVQADTGYFTIKDTSGKNVGDATTISFTTFPEAVIDTETKLVFYDCPGFSDTRDLAHDIAATYFTKRVIEKSERVKLVFTVNHSSVKVGENRLDFMLLVEQAVRMLKNIDKFNESISLVVTKVDHLSTMTGELVSDTKEIFTIAKFLEKVKGEMISKISQNNTSLDRKQFAENAVKFIDILLQKQGGEYSKIGIFRRPNRPGPLDDIPTLKEGKDHVRKVVLKYTKYTKQKDGDFGYTISADSRNTIHTLVEKIKTDVASNVLVVSDKIGKYYLAKEETSFDVQFLYDKFQVAYETFLSTKNCTSPTDFANRITSNVAALKIDLSRENLSKFAIYDHYLQFLKNFGDQKTVRTSEWIQNFNDLVDNLDGLQRWYGFLGQLNSILSEYQVQKDVSRFAKLKNSLQSHQNPELAFNSLKELLELSTRGNSNVIFNRIKQVKLDNLKLRKLALVLDWTLTPSIEFTYDKGHLRLKGRIVKLSDVFQYINDSVHFVEILALEKVLIDTDLDLTGRAKQLAIISPIWDVQGSHKISVDGAPGEAHKDKAENGGHRQNGKNGKPGNPGKSGGDFFGIGSVFINSQNLVISASGGKGGPGQHGGDGKDGENGNVAHSGGCDLDFDAGVYWKKICQYSGSCTGGTNGGDGGVGGVGGLPGRTSLMTLNGGSEVVLRHLEGDIGVNGTGGMRGKGGTAKKEKKKKSIFLHITLGVSRSSWVEYCSDGKNGIDGRNVQEIKPPEVVKFQPQNGAVNGFKIFALKYLKGSVRRANLLNFLRDLDADQSVNTLYDTVGFLTEFLDMEHELAHLGMDSTYTPFYKSLLVRIAHYAEISSEMSAENKKVLSYLYTAVLGKIISIQNHPSDDLVIDMRTYLEAVMNNVEALTESKKIDASNTRKHNYMESLEKKMNEAQNFIDTQITENLGMLMKEIDNQLQVLIGEVLSLQEAVQEDIVRQRKLEESLVAKMIMSVVNIIVRFLAKLVGPVAQGVQTVIETADLVGQPLLLGGQTSSQTFTTLPSAVNNFTTTIKNKIFLKKQAFNEQLADAQVHLSEFSRKVPSANISALQEKLSKTQQDVQRDIGKGVSFDLASGLKIFDVKIDLTAFLKNKAMEVGCEKETSALISELKTILNVPVELYKSINGQIQNDKVKIKQVQEGIKLSEAKLAQLEQYEQSIYNIMIPTIEGLANHVTETTKILPGKSQSFLAVSKWKIQSTLKDVKFQTDKLTQGFNMQENLLRYIDKLDEAMTCMINIYNRIEQYRDNAEFAGFISDVNSVVAMKIEVETPELKKAIDDLELTIQSNLVLQNYAAAMAAFKQYMFPFASTYMSAFHLPTYLQLNDTRSLVQQAVNNIQKIEGIVLHTASTISGKNDRHIYKTALFNSKNPRQSPFFIWRYESIKSAVKSLFMGKEVALKADVRHGIQKNAIKFNQIGVRFRLRNESLERGLEYQLHGFILTLTHLGNSYYRCGDRVYVIPSQQQAFSYSFAGYDKGNPDVKNMAYEKLKSHDPVLSPYAMWLIKLTSLNGHNFSALADYKNQEMDIELEGSGQYVELGLGVCTDESDHDYELERPVFEIEGRES